MIKFRTCEAKVLSVSMTMPDAMETSKQISARVQRSVSATPLRRWSWRVKVLSIGFGFLVAIGILEPALRILGIGYPNFYEPDPYCGSRLRKGTSGVWTKEGHGNISINSLGFRGPEIHSKAADVFRIVVVGDSFIEALQVDQAETFCVQLQNMLNEKSRAVSRTYEVINCGVSGYGTAQELLLLQNYLIPLNPDAVLLAVFPENDVRNNSRALEGDLARPYFTLAESGDLVSDMSFRSSQLWTVCNTPYERIKAAIVNRSRILQVAQEAKRSSTVQPNPTSSVELNLIASVNDSRYVYRRSEIVDPTEKAAWAVTERLIYAFAEECRSHRTNVFLFNVSSSIQAWPDPALRKRVALACSVEDFFESEYWLRKVCEKIDVPFFPLASAMQEEAERRGAFLHGFHNSSEGAGHWNQRGNAVAARLVSEWLLQKHLSVWGSGSAR